MQYDIWTRWLSYITISSKSFKSSIFIALDNSVSLLIFLFTKRSIIGLNGSIKSSARLKAFSSLLWCIPKAGFNPWATKYLQIELLKTVYPKLSAEFLPSNKLFLEKSLSKSSLK